MGGDHKCPVCQATFTRPQHVARHMRSHTGDRPYKCLYCGDQFARSDLLSRHCNKCHANEKPLSTTGSRRRGSASASRATTSKQACDQCVQSSLPCDGSNPCAKCVQRKCRCTYVKFHRQTAPVGPGHNTRPTTMGAAGAILPVAGGLPPHPDSHLPMYPHPDELLLGPQPSVVPPTGNSYSQSFAFPPIYSQHPADPAATLSLADNTVAAKYRSQSDLYRRTSVPLSTAPGAGLIPGLYTDPRQQPNWMAWGQENDSSYTSSTNGHPEGIHDKSLHPYMGTQGVLLSSTGDSAFPHPSAYIEHRDRRASTDYASEGSSATSHSVSSSAASSSVHLPMEGMANRQHYQPDQHSFTTALPADRAYANRGQVGGFSSAFGLMCLDDPNAMVSMPTDGAPFFSNDALGALTDDPNQTPVPLLQESKAQRQTPSKEAEIRELREFWKQYIRTPLSGPGPICSGNDASSPHTKRHHPSPPSAYRRPRVASMPSTKSPLSVDPERHHPQHRDDGNVTSSLRTTLTDDLKSYEAAVLARKAPTTLNLGPRARRKPGGPNSSQGGSPQIPSIQEEPKVINLNYSPPSSRPPSAMGVPALPSLANWSGKLLPVHLAYAQDQMSTSSPPSRESSLSVDDAAGSGGSDREGLRPSFKRLPSQTLGPLNTKRAQLSADEDGVARPDSGSSSGIPVPVYRNGTSDDGGCMDIDGGKVLSRPSMSVPDRPTVPLTGNIFEHGRQLQHAFQHPDRPVVNIADRHRRMSAPTMTAPSIPTFTFVAPPGPGPGANP